MKIKTSESECTSEYTGRERGGRFMVIACFLMEVVVLLVLYDEILAD